MPDPWIAVISTAWKKAYLQLGGDQAEPLRHGKMTMGETSRPRHDVEIAQRATLALPFGLVLAAFVLLAAGAAVYDIGKWLTLW
jgi:hypothetical protein